LESEAGLEPADRVVLAASSRLLPCPGWSAFFMTRAGLSFGVQREDFPVQHDTPGQEITLSMNRAPI
jgi:hypothetical protein